MLDEFFGTWDSNMLSKLKRQYAMFLHYYCNYSDYSDYSDYLQVRIEMGIPDKKWNVRKQNLANTIDNAGDNFRPILKTAWKEYIKKMNPVDNPRPPTPHRIRAQCSLPNRTTPLLRIKHVPRNMAVPNKHFFSGLK